LAVVDEVPPNVKVFDASGIVTATLHFDRDTSAEYVAPVVAISNTRLLVARPDLRRVELYDHQGTWQSTIHGMGFTPEAATALSDSTWLIYGPSGDGTDGVATWVHCLYLTREAAPRWSSALVDSTVEDERRRSGGPLPITVDGRVLIAHTGGVPGVLEASCAGGTATATRFAASSVRVVPRGEGRATLPRTVFDLGGAVATIGVERPATTWWRRLRPHSRTVSTVFAVHRDGVEPSPVRVAGRFEIMDERPGVGALFAVADPVPQLFLVDGDTLKAALRRRH